MASESNIARYAVLLIVGVVVSVLYLPQFSEKAVLTLFQNVPSMTFKNATEDVDGTTTEDSTINVLFSSLERQPIKFGTTGIGSMNKRVFFTVTQSCQCWHQKILEKQKTVTSSGARHDIIGSMG